MSTRRACPEANLLQKDRNATGPHGTQHDATLPRSEVDIRSVAAAHAAELHGAEEQDKQASGYTSAAVQSAMSCCE